MEAILGEVSDRRARGESVTSRDYEERFPHLVREIRGLFDLLDVLGEDPSSVGGGERRSEPFSLAGLPPRLGDFRPLEVIGQGGMGIVLRAEQVSLERDVALKVLLPSFASSPDRRRRFHREATSAARLDHPGIVRVYASGEEAGLAFLAMELVPDGRTLAEWIDEHRDTPGLADESARLREAAHMAAEVAEALDYAHHHGIVHRDVKPTNVLLTPEGRARLSDFGLVKEIGSESITRSDASPGTPRYMSPEQIRPGRRSVDRSTDVYSLGATLYEATTLTPAFGEENPLALAEKIRAGDAPRPGTLCPSIPRDLEAIITTAMERDRNRRYSSAKAMAQDLRRFLAGEPVRARPPGPLRRLTRQVRRNARIAITAVAIVALAAGVVFALDVRREIRAGNDELVLRDRIKAAETALDRQTAPEELERIERELRSRVDDDLTVSTQQYLHLVLGDVCETLGLWSEARASYVMVLEEGNETGFGLEAYYALAARRMQEGRLDRAETAFTNLLGPEVQPTTDVILQALRGLAEIALCKATAPRGEAAERRKARERGLDRIKEIRAIPEHSMGDGLSRLDSLLSRLSLRAVTLGGPIPECGELRGMQSLERDSDEGDDLVLIFERGLVRLSGADIVASQLEETPPLVDVVRVITAKELGMGDSRVLRTQAATGDFDGDGGADLVVSTGSRPDVTVGPVRVLFLRQSGNRLEPPISETIPLTTGNLVAADLDGDFRDDELVVMDQGGKRESVVLDLREGDVDVIPFPPDDFDAGEDPRLELGAVCVIPKSEESGRTLVGGYPRSHSRVLPFPFFYWLSDGVLERVELAGPVEESRPLLGERCFLTPLIDETGIARWGLLGSSATRDLPIPGSDLDDPLDGIFLARLADVLRGTSWDTCIQDDHPQIHVRLPDAELHEPSLAHLDGDDHPEYVVTVRQKRDSEGVADVRGGNWIGVVWGCDPEGSSSSLFTRLFPTVDPATHTTLRAASGGSVIVAVRAWPDEERHLLWVIECAD